MTRLRAVAAVLWKVPGAVLCALELHDWRYRSHVNGREWPWWRSRPQDQIRRCPRCHGFAVKDSQGDWRQVW